ncbi:prepilin-type N-terminal cleavage/methylation domain-containing protein [Arcobacter sp. YIC-310]|uniref:prepilin-type N-terminal cleavage/methylation domain-containing protein n=1 Tax=Arcobacter sp. YIC-310 TaxID=3376632 RepID=UPI003C2615F2
MKNAFSLLELIFAILIIGIIASVAVPKFIDSKDEALASTIKRDIVSATTAIQSYAMLDDNLSNIDEAIVLSKANWTVVSSKATFKENSKICVTIEVKTDASGSKTLKIDIDDTSTGSVCQKLLSDKYGIEDIDYKL